MSHPENLTAFGQALRQRRRELELTLDELAATTGISKPYLSNIETARAPGPPSAQKLQKIAAALHLDADELGRQADWIRTPASIRSCYLSGLPIPPRRPDGAINLDAMFNAFSTRVTDDMPAGHRKPVKQSPGNSTQDFTDITPIRLARVPLINRVAAGKPSEFTDLDYPVGIADDYILAPATAHPVDVHSPETGPLETGPTVKTGSAEPMVETADSGMFALRINGNSMEPLYPHGDIVVFSSVESPRDGDDCLVRLDADENFSTTFKRIYFLDGDSLDIPPRVRLVPLNTEHPERIILRETVTGIYPALWRLSPAPRARNKPSESPPKL